MRTLDVLTMLGLPDALVDSCRDILDQHAGELKKSKPPTTKGVFGGSDPGALLDHHAGIAHQHVADALNQMAEGLSGYAQKLQEFKVALTESDLQAAEDLTPSRKAALADISSELNTTNFHHHNGRGEG
jgi:hypothetical protein